MVRSEYSPKPTEGLDQLEVNLTPEQKKLLDQARDAAISMISSPFLAVLNIFNRKGFESEGTLPVMTDLFSLGLENISIINQALEAGVPMALIQTSLEQYLAEEQADMMEMME